MTGAQFEVYMLGSDARFVWVSIPDNPNFVQAYDWPGVKTYARTTGLPVRELDCRGVVTREYHPEVVDE